MYHLSLLPTAEIASSCWLTAIITTGILVPPRESRIAGYAFNCRVRCNRRLLFCGFWPSEINGSHRKLTGRHFPNGQCPIARAPDAFGGAQCAKLRAVLYICRYTYCAKLLLPHSLPGPVGNRLPGRCRILIKYAFLLESWKAHACSIFPVFFAPYRLQPAFIFLHRSVHLCSRRTQRAAIYVVGVPKGAQTKARHTQQQ